MPSIEISNTWRLFVAIELPASVRRKLTEHIDRLRNALPEARASWVRAENLHLTLKFLGDIQIAKVETLAAAVQCAASKSGPFEIVVGDCGAFPPRGQPRVLWIGIDDLYDRLDLLKQHVEAQCEDIGLPREQRPFHPHLTIARLRQPRGARHLAELHKEFGFDRETFLTTDLTLIRSELGSAGARHTIVARYELGSSKSD